MSRILPVAAIALALQGCPVDVPEPAHADADANAEAMRVFPDTSIHIDGFLEIDDVDGTGPLPGDADLCADGFDGSAVCPIAGLPLDNPDFPGPDPGAPDVLGADYLDWAELPLDHFFRDGQAVDDRFANGLCIEDGDVPVRADVDTLGIAANHTWLYLAGVRKQAWGPETWHFVFTRVDPYKTRVHGCLSDTWVWDLTHGDVRVSLTFPTRPRNADGFVEVQHWTGTSATELDASAMHTHPLWTDVQSTPPLSPAYAAFNMGSAAFPGEDDEYDQRSRALGSGLLGETAVDIASVFGDGCALDRVLSVLTTAPGLGNGDVPRDFIGPIPIGCSGLSAEVTVPDTCLAEVGWDVVAWDQRPTPPVVVPLPHPDLAVEITVDCGMGPVTVRDDDGSSSDPTYAPLGAIPVAVLDPTLCDVSATLTGTATFDMCVGEGATQSVVAPVLEAQADLTGSCVAVWTYLGEGHGGLPPLTYAWEFYRDGVLTWVSNAPEGFGPMGEGLDPVTIGGDLEVTDARGCTAYAYDEAVVHHPDGGTCP